MSNLTIKRVQQKVTLKRGDPTSLRVSIKEVRTVSVKHSGLRGPQGERGEQGLPGPTGAPGPAGTIDMPDLTLILMNSLV